MRIIEKKCPNCGANLEFNVGDKETKCKYCNTGFIIEDNNTDKKSFSLDNINLKYIKTFTIFHMVTTGVIMLIIVSTFLLIFYNIIRIVTTENDTKSKSSNFFEEVEKQKKKQEEKSKPKLEDISDELDKKLEKSSIRADKETINYLKTYHQVGETERIGFYYLKNTISVKIVYVMKSTYTNDIETKEIYKAFNFVGMSIDSIGTTPFRNPKTYKLNSEEFVYGYDSLEDLYNNTVGKEKMGYKVVATKNLYME